MKYCFSKTFLKTFYFFNSSSKRESTSRKKFKVEFKTLKQKEKKMFNVNNELREKQKVLVLELKKKRITEAQNNLQSD